MKKISFYVFAAILMLSVSSGCKKDVYGCTDRNAYNYNSSANLSNGSCIYYGPLMFWTNQNEGVVSITINGVTANITGYVTGGVPNCSNSVSANFYLQEGSYTYYVSAGPSPAYPYGYTYTGVAQVIYGQCQAYQL